MLRRLNLLDILGNLINPATYDAQVDWTQRAVTRTTEHDHIHEGKHYQVSDYALDLSINQEIFFGFSAPADAEIHMTCEFYSIFATVDYYEDSDFSGGTLEDPINNDRNSANVTQLQIYRGPLTITDLGSRVCGDLCGASKIGGDSVRHHELILKKGSQNIIKITSKQASNVLSYDFNYYED